MDKQLKVHGKVAGGHGHVVLHVCDKDLRKKQKLGEAKVVIGRYSLKYSWEQVARAEEDGANVLSRRKDYAELA